MCCVCGVEVPNVLCVWCEGSQCVVCVVWRFPMCCVCGVKVPSVWCEGSHCAVYVV